MLSKENCPIIRTIGRGRELGDLFPFFLLINPLIMKRIKINNCSVRIMYLAEPLGFKTLASFHKFIKQCDPQAKIYYNGSYMRAQEVLKALAREYASH